MEELQFKSVASGVEVKDEAQGLVEAVVARTEIVDKEGDLFLKGAFGEQEVRVSTYNHKSWPQMGGEMPVGKGRIFERGDEVVAQLRFFLNTVGGREHFALVKEMGELQEWSYGFRPSAATKAEVTEDMRAKGASRAFSRVPVVEVSPVMLGASVGTRTLAVKAEDATPPEDEALPAVVKQEDEPAPEDHAAQALLTGLRLRLSVLKANQGE